MYFEEFWAVPRMGLSRATNLPYNVDRFDSRSVLSSERIRDDFSLHAPCPTPIGFGIHFDLDLFVSNVENQIMDDHLKGKGQVVFTPRDLMMKSNPAMFSDVKDFTNPRDWYHSLQHDKKTPRSLTFVSSSTDASTSGVQGLKRTNSMANLSSTGTIIQKKHLSQSHYNLNEVAGNEIAETPSLAKTASFSLENLHYVPEETKENVKPFNLPHIKHDNYVPAANGHEQVQGHEDQSCSLPKLNVKTALATQSVENNNAHSEENTSKSVKFDPISAINHDQKMEKWITEVTEDKIPPKDGDIILQVNNADKIQHVPKIMSKDNQTVKRTKLPVLKPMQVFPNQFMELRIDKSTNINRERYKLKQKSLLHLKSLENDEKENLQKKSTEPESESKHYPYNMERFYIKEKRPTIDDIAKAKQVKRDGLTKLNLDQFAVEAYDIHPHSKFSFAKLQETTTAGLLKLNVPLHWQQYPQEISQFTKFRREGTKASIVNLTMEKNAFMGRSSTFVRKLHTVASEKGSAASTFDRKNKNENQMKIDGSKRDEELSVNSKNGQAKISKSVVSKVKQLKVFPEFGHDDINDVMKFSDAKQGVYKLDLKHYQKPSPANEMKPNENGILLDPDVDFQFATGEVIITRQSSTADSSNIVQKANSGSLNRERSKLSIKTKSHEAGSNDGETKLEDSLKINEEQEKVKTSPRSTTKLKTSAKSNKTNNTDKVANSMSPQNLSPKDDKNDSFDQWPEKEKTILDIKLPEKGYDSEATTSPTNMSPPSPPNTETFIDSPTRQVEKDYEKNDKTLPSDITNEEHKYEVLNKDSKVADHEMHTRIDVATSMSSLLGDEGRGPDGRRPPS